MSGPARLAARLDDLAAELRRWNRRVDHAMRTATSVQAKADSASTSLQRASRRLDNTLKARLGEVAEVDVAVQRLGSEVEVNLAAAKSHADQVAGAASWIDDLTVQWKFEFRRAQDWLRAASDRRKSAEQRLAAAERRLESASRELQRAQAALRQCQNDDQRRNCTSEARAVRTAQVVLDDCEQDVVTCRHELALAREDEQRASRRVDCTERAVTALGKAMAEARTAATHTVDALREAHRAEAQANAAGMFVDRARRDVETLQGEAAKTAEYSAASLNHTNRARTACDSGTRAADQGKSLANGGTRALQQAANRLRKLAGVRL